MGSYETQHLHRNMMKRTSFLRLDRQTSEDVFIVRFLSTSAGFL